MKNNYQITTHTTLRDIPAEEWCQIIPEYFPFSKHEFLYSLEWARCVGPETGWTPHYLVARREDHLAGALVLYLKTNSYGEYIFDWDWAYAYQQHDHQYYPKLTASTPFTPATGHKFYVGEVENHEEVREALLRATKELSLKLQTSSTHYLFIPEEELVFFKDAGYKIRKSLQYHWQNDQYKDFDDFLSCLKGRKAKQIRKERRDVALSSVEVHRIYGNEIEEKHAEIFYPFYLSTIDKKQAYPYLNLEFFKAVFKSMPGQVCLHLAKENNQWVAGSLSFCSAEKLYGRYWGALDDYKFLHFELCYYQPIEFAIEQRLSHFEAGAQGEHKIQRGFLPQVTYSAHHIESPVFREAIESFIDREALAVHQLVQQLSQSSPYK